MANETTTGAPLTATLGEQLTEKAHEGDAAAAEKLAEVGAASREREPEQPGAERAERRPRERVRRAVGRQPFGLGWAVAAGLGAWVAVRLVRRAFGR